jgi:hypothetical protein
MQWGVTQRDGSSTVWAVVGHRAEVPSR